MPTIQLNPDGSLPIKEIEAELYARLEEYSTTENPLEHRKHLGVSLIGEACHRKLWYGFRWVRLEPFIGRMRRLFKRGHMEEEKLSAILTWMGFFVREIDPTTNQQYRFSKVNGHYGGSSDTLALLPWFRNEDQRILCEYKTHNLKSFEKLAGTRIGNGPRTGGLKVKKAKPLHWAQMCGYGREFKVRYALYVAVCKDDDDIYFELLELDWNYAIELENKAEKIIYSKEPPLRISENPSDWNCTYCNYFGICHRNEPVEKNCRSCKFALPHNKGTWFCSRWDNIIPDDFIKQGCDNHLSVNG